MVSNFARAVLTHSGHLAAIWKHSAKPPRWLSGRVAEPGDVPPPAAPFQADLKAKTLACQNVLH